MKIIIIPVLVISLMLSLTGCADNGTSGRVMNQSTGIKDVIQSGIDIACRKTGQLSTKAHINTVEFKSGTARPRAHSRTART